MRKNHVDSTYREMQKIRIAMLNKFPFFGRQAMKLQMIEDSSMTNTLCTDGDTLWYNAEYVKTLTKKERIFVMAHEVMHIISLHHTRMRPGMDARLWNIAADYVINLILAEVQGLSLPEDILYDKSYEGMSTEKIYAKLKQDLSWDLVSENGQGQESDQNQNQESDPNQDSDQSQESGSDSSSNSNQDQNSDSNQDPGSEFNQDQNSDSNQDQGSDTDQSQESDSDSNSSQASSQDSSQSSDQFNRNQDSDPNQELKEQIEKLLKTAASHGMVIQNTSRDKAEIENEVMVDAALTKRLIEKNKQISDKKKGLPDALKSSIESISRTDTSWQRLLANFLNSHAQTDWNWMKPDPRYSQSDFIFPSLYSEAMPEFVIAVDTSGSIDRDKLKLFIDETNQILSSLDYDKVHIIYCADYLTGYDTFEKFEEIVIPDELGSGGTSYLPVWEYLKENMIHPRCLIYFTDLDIYEFEVGEDPGFDVLWVLFNSYRGFYYEPSFGTIIQMVDEGVLYNAA